MSYSEKDFETFQKNVLKPEDTFHFECEMCGRCCRNRQEPILITGADLYRIARALNITMMKAVEDCQRHLKMSFSAEIKCHFSPGSIQVYTALITDRLVGLKPVKS